MDNLDDFKQYARKVGKLLPQKAQDIADDTVQKSKELFYKMRRDTDRQRMAADVDIKVQLLTYIFCLYGSLSFDRSHHRSCEACTTIA